MAENKLDKIKDYGMERSVLCGIVQHGADLLFEIEDILDSPKDFHLSTNQVIYSILRHLVHERNAKDFDVPSIMSAAATLSYNDFAGKGREKEYVESLFGAGAPSKDNSIKIAACVNKLAIARRGFSCMASVANKLASITGEEKIEDLIATIEDPIFDFTGKIVAQENTMQPIAADFEIAMKELAEDPKDTIGIPTGFPKFDAAIGGGLRESTVNVVGARPKVGKSFLCLNMAERIASNGIPVLYLDTELTQPMQRARLTSLISKMDLEQIESGQFATIPEAAEAIMSCKDKINNLPITHCSIAGQSVQSVISIARRWLAKHVGFRDNGKAKPCLIIYDYIKLMDANDLKSNLSEFQMLGFLMTSLHNFAVRWGLPILATVQLNRDGVEKEGGHVISGSDRVLWLCSSFTILKYKTTEELNEDPPTNGIKKLIVTDTRFGPGMPQGEYINVIDNLQKAEFLEGKTFSQAIDSGFKQNKKK